MRTEESDILAGAPFEDFGDGIEEDVKLVDFNSEHACEEEVTELMDYNQEGQGENELCGLDEEDVHQ